MNVFNQKEVERNRLYKLVDQLVESCYSEDTDGERPEDLRMDTAAIVTIHVWGTDDGEQGFEGVAVFSETKKQYAVRGMLERALDRVKASSQHEEAW